MILEPTKGTTMAQIRHFATARLAMMAMLALGAALSFAGPARAWRRGVHWPARSPGARMAAALARPARVRRALAAVAVLAALVLFAPVALAKLPCPPGSVIDPTSLTCFPCGPNHIAVSATQCSACPAGTTAKLNNCVLATTTPNAAGWARPGDRTKSSLGPGLLESTPTFTPQGPAASGTPIGPRPGTR